MAANRLNTERLQVACDRVHYWVECGELPVALLAVANSREMLRCEVHGSEAKGRTDGIYMVASITKPVVATAVMQLVERGRLLLEDPVAAYLPEFASNGKEAVTLWHLLTHTSGMAQDYNRDKAAPYEGRLMSPAGYGHGGVTGTFLWIEPEEDLVVVFLTNRWGAGRLARRQIVNAVLGCLE